LILHGRIVDQAIDRPAGRRGSFVKEVVVTRGSHPLAMVRKRAAPNGGGTVGTVLLVHGFGQNRYAWHLPSRSLANHLAAQGFDVFNLDLRGHGRSRHFGSKGPKSVHDYIDEDLPGAVEEIQRIAGDRPIWLVGHSLGGLVSYAAAPGLEGAVAGIASIGSPYHFTKGSLSLGAVAAFVRIVSAVNVRPNPALLLKPVGLGMAVLRRFAESPLYPIPWRGWHKGNVEPDVLEEHLKLAFDRAGLAEIIDMFEWANERQFGGEDSDYAPRFEALDLPLLVVAGAHDDLAPPASVRPGFTASRSRDKTYRTVEAGHIDLLVGRDAPKTTWSILSEWLTARTR
jgi:alpha-beta hydrolase superfamily lysophospholipase